jgi:hypothetical protein
MWQQASLHYIHSETGWGAAQEYDALWSLPAIAPRPLLVANGAKDARCPVRAPERDPSKRPLFSRSRLGLLPCPLPGCSSAVVVTAQHGHMRGADVTHLLASGILPAALSAAQRQGCQLLGEHLACHPWLRTCGPWPYGMHHCAVPQTYEVRMAGRLSAKPGSPSGAAG